MLMCHQINAAVTLCGRCAGIWMRPPRRVPRVRWPLPLRASPGLARRGTHSRPRAPLEGAGNGGGALPAPGCLRAHPGAGAQVTTSRRETLWGQVAAHAAGQGRRASVADACAVAVLRAQVKRAWVTLASGPAPDFVMYVTDPVSEQLAELQLTLGEGPCHDVLASAAPVLAGDLGDDQAGRRWPAFTPGAGQLGARAVFAFPLMMGAILAGTMSLYRSSPGPLARPQLGDSLLLADTATVLLLDGAATTATGDPAARDWTGRPLSWRRTAPRSTRPRGCSRCSSASPPLRHLRGSGLTLTHRTGGSRTWPAISSPGACGCPPTMTPTPTRRRRARHDAPDCCGRPGCSPAVTRRWSG
jgi:hypothetical protein